MYLNKNRLTPHQQVDFVRQVLPLQNKIHNLSISLIPNYADAEDLTQEVLFSAYQKYHQFRHKSLVFTWLYRITLNCWKNTVRYAIRHNLGKTGLFNDAANTDNFVLYSESDNGTGDELDRIMRRTWLDKQLNLLTPKYRIPLELYASHLTFNEIAESLRCPVNTAKSLVYRAKLQLRDKLKTFPSPLGGRGLR